MAEQHYLVCYDVRQPKRLQRIHRYLQNHATPLQYSVFMATLSPAKLTRLVRQLSKLMDNEDDIRIFAVTPPEQAIWFGQDLSPAAPGLYWLT